MAAIRLVYGTSQTFRFRQRDINLIGQVAGASYPLRRSEYRLNGGEPIFFYVDHVPDPGIDWTTQYKDSPAGLRLKDQGDFNVEIPVTAPGLQPGRNAVEIRIVGEAGAEAMAEVVFDWHPEPLPMPLDLRHLSGFGGIQEIGQTVNGAFELDIENNLIRTCEPVYPDALLLLGSPHGSQEATYRVRFTGFEGVKWLGPSDFFVGHEEADPPVGVKPGWSSAGMAALNPRGEARSFLAFGDHCGTDREWVVMTDPPARFPVRVGVAYRVRHQVAFQGGVNRVRYRVWREGEPEPQAWLCEVSDADVAPEMPRHQAASFGLFQHSGRAIEWSDIRINAL